MAADLVVLDRDPFAIPAHEIADLRGTATMIAGRAIHTRWSPLPGTIREHLRCHCRLPGFRFLDNRLR